MARALANQRGKIGIGVIEGQPQRERDVVMGADAHGIAQLRQKFGEPGGEGGSERRQGCGPGGIVQPTFRRSEEHTSELQSLMRISYAVFCLKKKIQKE